MIYLDSYIIKLDINLFKVPMACSTQGSVNWICLTLHLPEQGSDRFGSSRRYLCTGLLVSGLTVAKRIQRYFEVEKIGGL